jgi:type IV pilus modification protein PilV
MLKVDRTPGFTLIEALVALTVLLLGIAGSAVLLLQTVRQERESGERRAAIRLAASMADQLRALRRPDGRPVLAISGVDPDNACADYAASCAAEQAAVRLLAEWTADASFSLPQDVSAIVTVPNPLIPEYLISIAWPSAGGGAQRFELPVKT